MVMSNVNKELQAAMLSRYRVHDHSQAALLRIEGLDGRSPSAKRLAAAIEETQRGEQLTAAVTYVHRHHSVRGLLEKLPKRLPVDEDDLLQEGVITLLRLSETLPEPVGSVGFQRALLVAIRRDLLDQLRWASRRRPRRKWEFVQMQDVTPEEGCSSEDPSAEMLGLYYKPLSPFRELVLRDALGRLQRAALTSGWRKEVLQDLLGNADVEDYFSAASAEHYRTVQGSYRRMPRSKVFAFHAVTRRHRQAFERELSSQFPPADRRFMLECAAATLLHKRSGDS
jgi:hypothetical protein